MAGRPTAPSSWLRSRENRSKSRRVSATMVARSVPKGDARSEGGRSKTQGEAGGVGGAEATALRMASSSGSFAPVEAGMWTVSADFGVAFAAK